MGAGTVSALTGGRFILGIGTGGLHQRAGREAHGARPVSPLALMRDYLTVLRGLLDGERVTHDGPAVTVRGLRLDVDPPPRTPVYLGALGPQMLRLAGERADGVALNWCTAEQVAWSRERIAEGAARAGRSPADVKVVQYIRVCVDDDEDRARRAFVPAMLGYALGRRGASLPPSSDRAIEATSSEWASAMPSPASRTCATAAHPATTSSTPSPLSSPDASATSAPPQAPQTPSAPSPQASTSPSSASSPPAPAPTPSSTPWPPASRLSWGRGRRAAAGEGAGVWGPRPQKTTSPLPNTASKSGNAAPLGEGWGGGDRQEGQCSLKKGCPEGSPLWQGVWGMCPQLQN